jgi:hypothetical protein
VTRLAKGQHLGSGAGGGEPGHAQRQADDHAQQAEVDLDEPSLATVKVPRAKGRLRIYPKEVVADKGYDRGIKPCMPQRWGQKHRPGRKADLAGYGQRWKWNGATPGWATIEGW